jgi:hypothetical protein
LGGTVLVAPEVLQLLILDNAGSGSLPVAVPPLPSMRGLNLNGQAAVLDPAAPQGFALTAAIEVWTG